ncbi:MAG: TetR/AcrR family transcriptional regulator [Solirubrobacteraceae bacterium]|nr:TetR/AcrR family transcriptional regulator [Solirubrobacteraceae bacterium]
MASTPRNRAARREREQELVAATRALFDARGVQDAPIDEIAREAGINKALIYRYFESKDELFAATLEGYLIEVELRMRDADTSLEPRARLEAVCAVFVDYGLEHPAFLDCALSLMRRPASELGGVVREGVMFRLGRAMAAGLQHIVDALEAGNETGDFAVPDPWFTANMLYAQALGAMQLARVGVGVNYAAPGFPAVFPIDREAVRRTCVAASMVVVGAHGAPA